MSVLRKMAYLLTVLSVVTISFAVVGCGDDGADGATDTASSDETPREGGSNNSDGADAGMDFVPPLPRGGTDEVETE